MNSASFNSHHEKLSEPTTNRRSATAPPKAFGAAAKRLYDILLSACGLLVFSPLFLAIAALIKVADGGAVFFRQLRIGLHAQPFLICKFRTTVPQRDGTGPLITSDGDARVTWIGRILRKTRLDDLPQLWNVLKGEMSLVGPRPEAARFVAQYTPEQRNILKLKPGITDLASLYFSNEELLLKDLDDVEEFYVRQCLPKKLQLNLEYAEKANLFSDTWIILQTVCPYWICLLLVYCVVLAASFWLSCQLIYDFARPSRLNPDFVGTMFAFVTVQLGTLIWRKQCRGLLSYFSLPELKQVASALGLACLLSLGLMVLTQRSWPPRNLILLDSILSLCALGGFRLLLRYWRERSSSGADAFEKSPVRVGIIGAGAAGGQLARELTLGRHFGRTVVAFFDDDFQKWHRCVHEIPVIGMPECLLDGWIKKLDEVIIAMPNAPALRIQEISRLLQKVGLRTYTAPSAHSIWSDNGNQVSGGNET